MDRIKVDCKIRTSVSVFRIKIGNFTLQDAGHHS